MLENSNKALAINSIILYVKLVVLTILSLLTTRYTLRALGIVDYGLFSLLGGIVSFIGIFNTIMLSTSNRFISVAVGKHDDLLINNTFNVNLIIHTLIAFLSLLIALPVGHIYIANYLSYDGPIINAYVVFYTTVIGAIISFIGVPYNGLLIAKEKFIVFSIVDVLCYSFRLIMAILLLYCFKNKVLIYSLTVSIFTALPVLLYVVICQKLYPIYVRLKLVREFSLYKEVFKFSLWISYGAIVMVAKGQGAAVIINLFFNTIMNTALGIANSVNSMIVMFAQNISKPIAPQLTKSYVSGDISRTQSLLLMSTKFSYLLMFFIASPFFIDCDWILSLWLGEIPPYASAFIKLLIIDALVTSLDSGISNLIFANGNIKAYQLVMNTIRLIAVIVAYWALKYFTHPYYLFISYILFNLVSFVACQIILHRVIDFKNKVLFRFSYLPSMMVTILFIPYFFLPIELSPLVRILVGMIYLGVLTYLIGLSKKEKKYINRVLQKVWIQITFRQQQSL